MNALKSHISFKVLALFLVATLLLPATHKMAHLIEHHEHKVCNGDTSTHFHQVDLDCDFQKFQLNHNFTFSQPHIELISPQETLLKNVSQYFFINKYKHFTFSLRAPPHFI